MSVNPAGVLLVIVGVVAVIVGVRGSQKQTWAALFGKSSSSSTASNPKQAATLASPAGGLLA